MGNAFWFDWEPKVIIFIQNILNPILEKIAEIITFFGDEYAMILILGFLYWGYKKDLGKIEKPVIIFSGEEDKLTPFLGENPKNT